jgi:hypothetical protein
LEEGSINLLYGLICSLLGVLLDEKWSKIEATFRVDVAFLKVAFGCSWRSQSLLLQENITRVLTNSREFACTLEVELERSV